MEGLKDKIRGVLHDGELLRYVVIGAATTVVDFVLFAIMTKALDWDGGFSNVLSIAASMVFAYAANKIFVFRTHCSSVGELLGEAGKFFSSRIGSALLEIALVFLLFDVAGLEPILSKLAVQVVIFVLNYVTSKFWAFRR